MDVTWARRLVGALSLVIGSLALSACGSGESASTTQFRHAKGQCETSAHPSRFLVRWKNGVVSVETAKNKNAFISEILEPLSDEIDFAEHDQIVSHVEPKSGDVQSNALNAEQKVWGPNSVGAPIAWSKGIEGQGVIVAVIDSGASIDHVQLRDQLAINPGEIPGNGIDDDGNGLIDDVNGYDFEADSGTVYDDSGHGTHVAGVIVAAHEKGEVLGIAPKAKLLPLDFMYGKSGNIGDAITAIRYAASRGAKVINASWGGAPCSMALQEAILELEARGILFVAASGNGDERGKGVNLEDDPSYPAAYGLGGMLTVGAVTPNLFMASFSNYSTKLVNLLAPGTIVWSTYNNGGYKDLDGTSMAAPFVSAAAALLWSHRPEASVAQIRQALLRSVDTGRYAVSTSGRLNVAKAITELETLLP